MAETDPLLSALYSELSTVSADRYWLACSGGLDSRVLLDLIQRCRADRDHFPPVHVVHINHQLQADAPRWAAQVEQWCAELALPCVLRSVVVANTGSLEQAARNARYRVFESIMEEGDVLLMAHHRDDQAETLLQRLLRGAGLEGMAGIPRLRRLGAGQLFRPLLGVSRRDLASYAWRHELDYFHDPSNDSTVFDRNFLRHRIMPVLAERWPDAPARMVRVARHQRSAADLLNGYLDDDLDKISGEHFLDIDGLKALPEARQPALLRRYLQRLGLSLEEGQLREFFRQFVLSGGDTAPRWSLGSRELYRFKGRLYHDRLRLDLKEGAGVERWRWSPELSLELPGGILSASPGGGFRPGKDLHVRLRQGGERCILAGESHSRSLKKLLQEWQIPPHHRGQLPLIYCGDTLAAIADLAVCDGFVAGDDEPGWHLHWSCKR